MKKAAINTPVTPGQVYDALEIAWKKDPELTAPNHRMSLLVLLAQWALETGRGLHMHNYNLGNIKSNATSGDWCFFACNEIIGGKVVWFEPDHPSCCFRSYPTLEAGAEDYLTILRNRFSKAWPAVLAGDPYKFVSALKNQGYFTANVDTYRQSVVSLFNEFWKTDLRYDLGTTLGIQRALASLGYDPGEFDGRIGFNVRAAVRHFQLDRGLEADGIIGPLTKKELSKALAEVSG